MWEEEKQLRPKLNTKSNWSDSELFQGLDKHMSLKIQDTNKG